MTTLLRSGVERILRAFCEERSIHVRELSRRTGLSGQSLTRLLAALEKGRILVSAREGNQRRYRLCESRMAYAALALLDAERYERLPSVRRQAIAAFLQALPQQPVFAVLFGSLAKGNHTEASDVDLLLVGNERIRTAAAEKEADVLHAVRISPFQMTYDAFKRELKLKEDRVVQSAIKTGYPLTNHIQYYEMTRHEGV